MRKIYITLLTLFLVTVLVGCGNDKKETLFGTVSVKQSESSTIIESNKESSVQQNAVILSDTYKVPGKKIYIDIPNYQEMEKGYTELFIVHGVKYIAVTAVDEEEPSALQTAHEMAFDIFRSNIQNYSYVNELNIISDEIVTVNGIEMYKYIGNLNCGHDTIYETYAIGYSFIMDGIACNITGAVIDEGQDQEIINEITNYVEAMVQTLRSEK